MKHFLLCVMSISALCINLGAQPIHTFTGGVDTAWIRHFSTGQAPLNSVAVHGITDSAGNLYVVGSVGLIKYNAAGEMLWRVVDIPWEGMWDPILALDSTGNVLLAGRGSTNKYSGSGELLWKSKFPSGSSASSSIVVDAKGFVYTTGKTNPFVSETDFFTVKYRPDGDTVWTRTYGPVRSDSWVFLAVDTSGNVYIAGTVFEGLSGGYNYFTAKYSPSGGMEWTRHFDSDDYDYATGLVLDRNGNVYITGYKATTKYACDGTELWTKPIGGSGIGIDNDNHLYVIGTTTSKLDTGGTILWANTLNGGWCSSFAVTHSGEIGLTSWDSLIVRYNSNGDTLWSGIFRPDSAAHTEASTISDLVFDRVGNMFSIGTAWTIVPSGTAPGPAELGRYLIIKHDQNGTIVWKNEFQAKTCRSVMQAFDVDPAGNVLATGRDGHWGSGERYDPYVYGSIWTIKVDSTGELQWSVAEPTEYSSYSRITAGDDGSVFVTGQINGDHSLFKYTSTGKTTWSRKFDVMGHLRSYPTALAADANGYVYSAGNTSSDAYFSDYETIKYTPSGDTAWVRRYNGPGNSLDRATALAVDGSGNVYVTGQSDGSGTSSDYATIKYTPNGDTAWVRRYNGPGNDYEEATALVVDGGGNVYVTGWSFSGTSSDYATIKYTPNGDTAWVRRYNGPGYSVDYATALAVDGSGNVYVTGTSYSRTSSDYTTIKYTPTGDTAWVRRYNGPGNIYDNATALAVDGSGNVYVTGSRYGSGRNPELVTIKYGTSGNEEWITRTSDGSLTPVGIKVDASGSVYVAGTSSYTVSYEQSVYTIIKFTQIPTSVEKPATNIPTQFALSQNYPNPFNPSTTIRYALPSSAHVRLTVYNLLGQVVSELVNEEQSAGWKEVQWDGRAVSSGIYFYRIHSGTFVEVKKMILIK